MSLRPSSKSSFLAWEVRSGEHDAQQYCKKARAERGKRELVNLNRHLMDDWRAPNFTNRRARTGTVYAVSEEQTSAENLSVDRSMRLGHLADRPDMIVAKEIARDD